MANLFYLTLFNGEPFLFGVGLRGNLIYLTLFNGEPFLFDVV